MPTLTEGNLALTFDDDWRVTKYDDWSFYRNRFASCCNGNKAVDFTAYDPAAKTLWLIELKDFRGGRARTKPIDIWDEAATKVRDSLAGLLAAKVADDHDEHGFANSAVRATKIRVVLHLEQTANPSKLFPRPFDRASVQQKLKQLVKPIDAHPEVVELNEMASVPWVAQAI